MASELYPIEVRVGARPISVAFVVPEDEDPKHHLMLDAAFAECYRRWGGVFSLMVPWTAASWVPAKHLEWAALLDVDLVYSFVDLDANARATIHEVIRPVALIVHTMRGRDGTHPNDFQVEWSGFGPFCSSLTLLPSLRRARDLVLPNLLAIDLPVDSNRFLFDNFGSCETYSLPDAANIQRYVQPAPLVGDFMRSEVELIQSIRRNEVSTMAELAFEKAGVFLALDDVDHRDRIVVTVGDTIADRISAWNQRTLTPNHLGPWGSVRMGMEQLRNSGTCNAISLFLGAYVSNNHPQIHLTSRSLAESDVRAVVDKYGAPGGELAHATWLSDAPMPGERTREVHRQVDRFSPLASHLVHRDAQKVPLVRPKHVTALTGRMSQLAVGGWVTELCIGRTADARRAINVDPVWRFPARNEVSRLVASKLGRIGGFGRVHVLAQSFPSGLAHAAPLELSVSSPQADEVLITALGLQCTESYAHGVSVLNPSGSFTITASDKGQRLRGVMGLLGGLEEAFRFICNGHWRTLLIEFRTPQEAAKRVPLNSFISMGQHQAAKMRLAEVHRTGQGEATKLFAAMVKDAIEEFIHRKVCFRGYEIRCQVCGSINFLGLHALQETTACTVCSQSMAVPLEPVFLYVWNDFIRQTLIVDHGLPVLYGLGREWSSSGCFTAIPEADIRWGDGTANEIDFIALRDGQLVIGEGKSTVEGLFMNPECVDKLVQVAMRLRADRFVLAFERWGDPARRPELQALLAALRLRIQTDAKMACEVVIAADDVGFTEAPVEFGSYRERTWDVLKTIEQAQDRDR